MRKSVFFLFALLLIPLRAVADEGMWILSLLSQYNLKQMQDLGCHLSPEQIYSINNASLKDAVVIFGGGCTGEIVSNEGLVFTNHHCGYDAIQQLSSVEHNYLKDGFWATSKDMELPVKGLKVRFLDKIEDVTDQILTEETKGDLSPLAYQAMVSDRVRTLELESSSANLHEEVVVESFFGGNQFFRITYKVFSDIRMVGTPPESIGKFGHDTDNWHWPRHTGDFSIFRVYANSDNEPADYSANNVPLKPKHFLPVSLKGNKPGDYAMTIGYPGSTDRYLSSWGVAQTMNAENASRIEPRKIKEDIWLEAMRANPDVYIKYSVKYAHSSNYHLNSVGMNKGINDLDVIKRKQLEEKEFAKWAKKNHLYAKVLKNLKKDYKAYAPYAKARAYWSECLYSGVELFRFSNKLYNSLLGDDDENITEEQLNEARDMAKDFFKDYVPELDKKVAVALFSYYYENIDKKFYPSLFDGIKSVNQIPALVDRIFSNTSFGNEKFVMDALDGEKLSVLREDGIIDDLRSVVRVYFNIERQTNKLSASLEYGNRLYIAGRMQMHSDKAFYSDANFTCRLSYGKVGGYTSQGKEFSYFTDLEGVMAKEDPNNWEFIVSDKLKSLFNNKDFGPYADADGRMHVCFITDNDITGGNSGSPVINGDGELIGLAFDGNWEAMSGDIIFEPNLQRCICVDIRYVLFVIDKFGGAQNLIDELAIRK